MKELELFGELDDLMKDKENYVAGQEDVDHDQLDGSRSMIRGNKGRQGSIFKSFGFGRPRRSSTMSMSFEDQAEDDSDDDADETVGLTQSSPRQRRKTLDSDGRVNVDDLRSSRELPNPRRRASQAYEDHNAEVLRGSRITLKKRIIGLYVSLCELKSFIQLNKTGFSKALKKYDKILNRNLRNRYIDESVSTAAPFSPITMQHLDENISDMEKAYAKVATKDDVSLARRELRLHLREHVVWERNTVWRDMIGIERKAQAANLGLKRTLLGGDHDSSNARLQGDEEDPSTKELVTPIGKFTIPRWIFSSTLLALILILVVFVVLLTVPIMDKPEQQNCLAMLVFVSLLWATEVGYRCTN